ncbi:MAG: hypothetical protein KDC26_09660 [Armatimonadetes bacterium]|nr:hypothetical protein [Armatimonadota bacterium]
MRAISSIAFFALIVPVTQAQTLFSTFGPGNSYIQNVGRSFSGADNSITHIHSDLGWQFSTTTSDYARSISLATRYWEGTNAATVRIHANTIDDRMGAILGEWQLNNMPFVNASSPPQTIDIAPSHLFLSSTEKYWLVLSPPDSTLYAAWMDNNQGITGRMAWSNGVNNFSYVNNMPMSAFSISSVPEPSSLVALSLVPVVLRRRKKSAN